MSQAGVSSSLLLIPVVYLILLLGVGFVLARRQQSKSDFYVASSSMGGAVLFATIFSTVVGANTYMGFSGQIYSGGFSTIWLLAAAGSAYFLLFFISGKIRKIASEHRVFTLPDMIELRYNRPAAFVVTFFSLIALVGGAGGSILGIGLIVNTLLGINTTLAVVITSVVTIVYTAFGGLWGVAITDWVQTIIMVAGLALVVAFGFPALAPEAGFLSSFSAGTSEISSRLGADTLSLTQGVTLLVVIVWAITFMPLNTISQTQIQRVYAARSAALIRRISLLMVLFVGLFAAFSLAMVGTLGAALRPGLENPETVFPVMALEVINPVVGMIVVTGILGAAMSTVDSNLLGAGIHVSRDIVERGQRDSYTAADEGGEGEGISESRGLGITRWSIVVIGTASTVAALVTPSILELLLTTQQIFAGATFVPILAGLYWRRANSSGALTAMILGGGSTIICEAFGLVSEPLLVGIVFSIIGLVAGTLLTRRESSAVDVSRLRLNLKPDLPWLALAVTFCVAFFFAIGRPGMWPYVVGLSVVALCVSVVLLLVYFVRDLYSSVPGKAGDE
ncbi:sodium:solute symporter family protein [Rubrobacter aplysinae]|uniref:sodium:solute symporter family protein n=1 Tax=Rubrobacter aplysinae TaxID=909625 RepID=UPI00064BA83D|nr:sodium:solute symporter family protein [Rubrobacter aplysinae]